MTFESMQALWLEASGIWRSGGWCMVALALNGIVIFALGVQILFRLPLRAANRSADRIWRTWQQAGKSMGGVPGRILTGAQQCVSLDDMQHYFDEFRNGELHPFERDLRLMTACVSAALLLGLLGTVTGMLSTFQALASGSGGERTMDLVASGISEALITTETGLVLALSGLAFQFVLTRQHQKFGKMVAHLESLCMQSAQQRIHGTTSVAEG